MANAKSSEWKIATFVCDWLYPDHKDDRTILGEVVRRIAEHRENEVSFACDEFDKLAVQLRARGKHDAAVEIVGRSCEVSGRPFPDDVDEYLDSVRDGRNRVPVFAPEPIEEDAPEVFVKRRPSSVGRMMR